MSLVLPGVVALGLCASVLIAWAGALWAPLTWGPEKPIELEEGQLWGEWPVPVPWPLLYTPSDIARAGGRVLSATRYAYHHGESMDAIYESGMGSERVQLNKNADLYDAGWPWPALRWTVFWQERRHFGGPTLARFDRRAVTVAASGWPAPSLWNVGGNRRVPLMARWGLLWDTLVYACAIAAVAWGPRIVRRATRGWRGCCVACGYDRRGLPAEAVCPECGRSDGGAHPATS
jgi:hypothetical protein